MLLQECYEKLHGDYNDALARLMNKESLVERILLKFPNDPSMKLLLDSVEAGNIEESFRGAHTLKGVAANLGLTELQKASSDLTEQLRPCTEPADAGLLEKVKESYDLVIATIEQYQSEK